MCQVLPVPLRATLRDRFRLNVHPASAWYVRAYMTIPARLMPLAVMTARVGTDCRSHVRFVRL